MTHVPTDKDRASVEAMAGYGIPHDDIARVLRIAPKTLRVHYRDELDRGAAVANVAVAQSLYQKALGPGKEGVTAAIFWLKCRAGWREKDADAPGKKEQAEAASRVAERGTDWDGLIIN